MGGLKSQGSLYTMSVLVASFPAQAGKLIQVLVSVAKDKKFCEVPYSLSLKDTNLRGIRGCIKYGPI